VTGAHAAGADAMARARTDSRDWPPGVLIECRGEPLWLLAERAVLWPTRATLLVADWHIGKASVFGRHGLAVPEGDLQRDLARLDALIAACGVRRLIVLGDLMHAPPAPDDHWPGALGDWLARHAALEFLVVAGNHDRVTLSAIAPALESRVDWFADACVEPPFVFLHEPAADPRGFVLCGHLHPMRRLRLGNDSIRAPAFWFRDDHAVLPAFGSFLGGVNIRPSGAERVYVAGPDAVVDVSKAMPRRGGGGSS
jgi:DNA ligase-associated metallophosphoesterase